MLIGVPRFELGTSPTRTERATRLRHTPSRPVSHRARCGNARRSSRVPCDRARRAADHAGRRPRRGRPEHDGARLGRRADRGRLRRRLPQHRERDGVVEQLLPDVRPLGTHADRGRGADARPRRPHRRARPPDPHRRADRRASSACRSRSSWCARSSPRACRCRRSSPRRRASRSPRARSRSSTSASPTRSPTRPPVAITTPLGVVVMTGDYKLDDTQANPRRRADSGRLGALGRAGVLAMLGDSTNADEPGRTGSEDSHHRAAARRRRGRRRARDRDLVRLEHRPHRPRACGRRMRRAAG